MGDKIIPTIPITSELIVTFFVGLIATAVTKFLTEYIKNKNKPSHERHIFRDLVVDDYIFILCGGLFTVAMSPLRIQDAILYGATWDALFLKLFVKKDGVENENH